jgi:hypothetical protein
VQVEPAAAATTPWARSTPTADSAWAPWARAGDGGGVLRTDGGSGALGTQRWPRAEGGGIFTGAGSDVSSLGVEGGAILAGAGGGGGDLRTICGGNVPVT